MTLTEKAYLALRHDIVRGSLMPGQPLRMAELSQRYEMGFSPLREALTRLHSERLVVAIALKGFTVSELSLEQMWDAVRVRIHIECEALKLSIKLGEDDWEARVVSTLHGLTLQAARKDETGDDGIWELEARHHAFHLALISACGSVWMMEFFERLYAATERYRIPILLNRRQGRGRDVQAEHTALSKAALARQTDRAVDLLTQHYTKTAEAIALRMNADINFLSKVGS